MTGWVILALFVALAILRASRVPEARLAGGVALMGLGVWLIWAVAVHRPHIVPFRHASDLLPLLFGVWLVVRGALRFAAY